jgi:hypothetical protein
MKPRTSLAAAAAIAGLVALAGPAQAAPPQADLQHYDLPADTPSTDGYCAFPVTIDYLTNQRARKVTTNPDGSVATHLTGFASATVTRSDTGQTLEFKISGPGTLTNFPSGAFNIDATGPNLLWTTVDNSAQGVPQIAYTTGPVHVEVDASGKTTQYNLTSGRSINVCDLLA